MDISTAAKRTAVEQKEKCCNAIEPFNLKITSFSGISQSAEKNDSNSAAN